MSTYRPIAVVLALQMIACFSAPPRPAATDGDVGADAELLVCTPGEAHPEDACQICNEAGGYAHCLACRGGACLPIRQIVGTLSNTCALLETGEVLCWGDGGERLVPGSVGSHLPPTRVKQAPPMVQLAAGSRHVCGLTADGEVYCWGRNGAGQTGLGSQAANLGGEGILYTPLPVRVQGGDFSQVVAGGSTSCAQTAAGELACWGAKTNGQGWTPNDYDLDHDHQPFNVAGLRTHQRVALTGSTACAIDTDGRVACWGNDNCGTLGVSKSQGAGTADLVFPNWPGDAPETITAGSGHVCATRSGGSELICWGCSSEGQTGQQLVHSVSEPSDRSDILPAPLAELHLGWRHTCSLTTEGKVWCWGRNADQQVGPGGQVESEPRLVERLPRVRRMGSGRNHVCGADDHHVVRCWGRNDAGQAAPDSDEEQAWPPAVVAAAPEQCGPGECALEDGRCVDTGTPHPERPCETCGANGTFDRCFACRENACVDIARLNAGRTGTCAQLGSGEVVCWGQQAHGLTGGEVGGLAPPTQIAGLPIDIAQLEVGGEHACVRTEGGEVHCWGRNQWGQVGSPEAGAAVPTPLEVGIDEVIDLDAGNGDATCALRGDGSVHCWGVALDGNGEGDPDGSDLSAVPQPTPVEGLTALTEPGSLAVGSHHACARVADETGVVCWGNGQDGTLANGDYQDDQLVPGPIGAFWDGPSAVYAGGSITAAQDVHGAVYLWGRGFEGANGAPTFISTTFATPLDHLFRGEAVLQLGLGWRFGCGLLEGGALECWGWDESGELGAWAEARQPVPVRRRDLPPLTMISVGHQHTCGVDAHQVLRCWGRNDEGQLGGGENAKRPTPDPVVVVWGDAR